MAEEAVEKGKALELALTQINKNHGKGTIMRMSDRAQVKVDVIPTGSISLDWITGIGGIPRGRIVEIYGPEASGKTTLALHIISEAQKQGGTVAFIDAEHALDVAYAERLGVNIDELLVSQPDDGEQALDIVELLVRSNAVDAVVVDSVAALVPRAELEGDMGDSRPGAQARLMSQAMRKLTAVTSKSNTCAIFINQTREKIGVMFGSPITTTGGHALKFYASMRMEVKPLSTIKDKNDVVGRRVRVKIVKNKLAPPFREIEFDVLFGKGICRSADVLDLATEWKIIDKSGSWLSYHGEKVGQGRENVRVFLEQNPEVFMRLEQEVRDKIEGVVPKSGGAHEEEAPADGEE